MMIDLREIQRQQGAIADIRRRVNASRKDWIPALDMAIRELERLKSGRSPREREMPRRMGEGMRKPAVKKSDIEIKNG